MKMTKRLPLFDATLDTSHCNARTNATLKITLRVGFRQINPAGGATDGTYHDFGDPSSPSRKINKWTAPEWNTWKINFCRSAQRFWDNKFWLINNSGVFPYRVGSEIFLPNFSCRFELIGSEASAGFHNHVIDVVRLDDHEPWFGSHSTLYDSKDTNAVSKGVDSGGHPIMQRAHVHEIGHLLGLGHVAIGQPGCLATGNTNASACYGITDTDKNSVMGAGMRLDPIHASPWLSTLKVFVKSSKHSTIYVPPAKLVKPTVAKMRRYYPRTTKEYEHGKQNTHLPPGR